MWSSRQTALLGVRAAVVAVRVLGGRAVDEHAIADGDRLDVRADRFDLAAGIGAGDEGQRGLARVRAAADVHVDGIHADGSQSNDHLIGARLRIGNIFELQHLGAAVLANDDRLHGAMLS